MYQKLTEGERVILKAARDIRFQHLMSKNVSLQSPQETRDWLKEFLWTELYEGDVERFCLLHLNTKHEVIKWETLTEGTLDRGSVHPRELIKKVLEAGAAAVILAHNHPSGVAKPSPSDWHITHAMRDALKVIEVDLLDHFIVGRTVVSMREDYPGDW